MLVEKTGINNTTLKDKVIEILKKIIMLTEVYPLHQTTILILKGLLSKNKKTQAEILPVIDFIIDHHNMSSVSEKHLKEIVKLVDSNDQGIRNNAINVCVTIYSKFLKEDFWRVMNRELNQKMIDMIKQRLKMQGLLEENEPTPKSSGGMRQTMKSPNRSLTGNLNASTSNKAKDFGNKTPQKGIGRASTAKVHQ